MISSLLSEIFIVILQKTGKLIVINLENDHDKDKDMVQLLLGESAALRSFY